MALRLIHLSDPQVIPAGEINYDIDPQARINRCINAINKTAPSVSGCMITGDLTHWGQIPEYEVLKEALLNLSCPVFLMMGNHDRREHFQTVFETHPAMAEGFIQYSVKKDGLRLICLDTLDEGKRGGLLCQARLKWLEQELASSSEPVYLFMHHPPFKVGLTSMDKDNLANSDGFWNILNPHRHRIRHLFLGHLHRTVTGSWKGISFSCPPSPVHQTPFEFENESPGFVSPEPAAYHLVELTEETVVVNAHYFLHDSPSIDSRSCRRYQKPASE